MSPDNARRRGSLPTAHGLRRVRTCAHASTDIYLLSFMAKFVSLNEGGPLWTAATTAYRLPRLPISRWLIKGFIFGDKRSCISHIAFRSVSCFVVVVVLVATFVMKAIVYCVVLFLAVWKDFVVFAIYFLPLSMLLLCFAEGIRLWS